MILPLQARLADAVRAAARSAFGAELGELSFQYPPRLEMGDLALTAPFDLARTLRRKPREIADRLAADLAGAPGVRRAEVAGGGYVNLFLDRAAFARELHGALRGPVPPPRVSGHVIVEHTSINPNKSAHIGHLRNATLGDTFMRVLRHRGREVGIQNYIDDTGVQVADVVVGFLHMEKKGLAEVERIGDKFDDYCWDLYARVGDFYAQDPARRKLQAETLHAIETGGNEAARLAAHVAARIVDCHLATMERLAIRYDLLARESDILRLHFWERAFELLKQAGALRLEAEGKNAGCWVLTMEAEGSDEDKIIVRSNGTVTYTGKDIAYQLWKLGKLDRDFRYRRHRAYPDGQVLWSTTSEAGEPGAPVFGHANAVYNVIDVGQSYPQRVVKAGVAALAGPEAAAASHHLAYEKVVLSPATARALGYAVAEDEGSVKVSGRKGLGVKANDLLDALVSKARTEIDARDPERDAAAKEVAAKAIAVGALRYFLLKFGRTKIITFDMEEALAFTGETGPYVQNGVVRARNIFAKLEAEGHRREELAARAARLDLGAMLEGEEGDEAWSLLVLMARSDEVAEQAVKAEEVSLVAKHAFAVAQAFHGYYQNPRYSVLHAENEDRRAFRALLVDAFLRQMEVLTALLGIPIPDKM
ncbi:MAG TPA: arginine--tRNA ligase [Vicinamibacteria bacterium]|jgi:arginyl-tRNA synthetase